MKTKTIAKAIAILGVLAGASSAKYLPYSERVMKYPAEQGWESYLLKHWEYWKAKFIGSDGVVNGTKPDGSSAKVSEAQSYAMLMALWFNDQATFNKVYHGTQQNFWNSSTNAYMWIISPDKDANWAGDADQDILAALIFASALVDSNTTSNTGWTNPSGDPTYKEQAKTLMNSIWDKFVDKSSYRIQSWPSAGDGVRNPSYHMPAWYQVFKEFANKNIPNNTMDWDKVRLASYALFNAQPSHEKGMARNFSTGSGDPQQGNGQSSPTPADMGFDAIRVPWRIGMDAAYYPTHTQAVNWCKSVWTSGFVDPSTAGMYTLSGSPQLYGWGSASSDYSDSKYEWAMTVAMWGVASTAVRDSCNECGTAAGKSVARLKTGVTGQNYFVISANTDTTKTTAPNKNYYAQSLALLGALSMDGRAWNVWDDLMNKWTAPDTSTKMVTPLKATPSTIALSSTTRITAKFNHAASVKLQFTGKTSGVVYTTGLQATADSVGFNFTPSSNHPLGKLFTAGEDITVTIVGPWTTAPATATTTITTTASSAVAREHRSVLAWTAEGLRIPGDVLAEGQSVQIRVLDLAGRQQGASVQANARTSGQDLILDVAPFRGRGAGLLELRANDGSVERLLLPPVR